MRSKARGRILIGLVLATVVSVYAVSSAAAVPSAQVPTPTPFRFLTPTPLVPGKTTTTTTAPTTPMPRAGGFPIELAIPALAGGLAAIGGGAYLFRRKKTT
jgi:LPXTG-motif cell wall-anchored protein